MNIFYVGWLNVGEPGTVGTHMVGALRAFDDHDDVDFKGFFLRGALPPCLQRQFEAFKTGSSSSKLEMSWLLVAMPHRSGGRSGRRARASSMSGSIRSSRHALSDAGQSSSTTTFS